MLISSQQRILVPTDFSETAARVQGEVLQFVDDPTQVHILHVLSPLNTLEPGAVWQTVSDRQRIQQVTTHFRQRFAEASDAEVTFSVAVGTPSVQIVDYAKKHDIDVIVIASHGRTGMAHFLLGSVAERVVRLAPCPVLVWRSRSGQGLQDS